MHPFNAIISLSLLILQLLVIKEPCLVMVSFVCLVFVFFKRSCLEVLKKNLTYSLWPVGLILLVNPLFINLGNHILVEGTMGKLYWNITLEALAYSCVMVIKLLSIILSIQLLSIMTDKEDMFTFMSTHCRQLTLTFSMSINAIDAIRSEFQRVEMVMETRGLNRFNQVFWKRIQRRIYLIKVVLISMLEGSFHRSEALYVRHYTKQSGSAYRPLKWQIKESGQFMVYLIIGGLLTYAMWTKQYAYDFYPTFAGNLRPLPIGLVILMYGMILYGVKEQYNNVQLSA